VEVVGAHVLRQQPVDARPLLLREHVAAARDLGSHAAEAARLGAVARVASSAAAVAAAACLLLLLLLRLFLPLLLLLPLVPGCLLLLARRCLWPLSGLLPRRLCPRGHLRR
jgi:hypothetical protein